MDIDPMSQKEIAAALGIHQTTVSFNEIRALKKLIKGLQADPVLRRWAEESDVWIDRGIIRSVKNDTAHI